ncbi:hypothetical protein JCM33374_g1501 [Metschnikowia sp. JCM 33374]|nr:hypothetical protein JCM33374_g1501 [Metschnikowia sp. JCM 33374]
MFYDKIDRTKLSLGKPQDFNDEGKFLIPVYYDGVELNFALKNKYVVIVGIETNVFEKKFITVKSKEYAEVVNDIADQLNCASPIMADGSFRANLNSKTKFSEEVGHGSTFNACISLNFPTIFKDKRTTLQINVRDIFITKIYKDELEVDISKLEKAM